MLTVAEAAAAGEKEPSGGKGCGCRGGVRIGQNRQLLKGNGKYKSLPWERVLIGRSGKECYKNTNSHLEWTH